MEAYTSSNNHICKLWSKLYNPQLLSITHYNHIIMNTRSLKQNPKYLDS